MLFPIAPNASSKFYNIIISNSNNKRQIDFNNLKWQLPSQLMNVETNDTKVVVQVDNKFHKLVTIEEFSNLVHGINLEQLKDNKIQFNDLKTQELKEFSALINYINLESNRIDSIIINKNNSFV